VDVGTIVKDREYGFQEPPSSKDLSWWRRFWEWTSFGKRSGWDWLDLLVVSLALAVIGIWFSITASASDKSRRTAPGPSESSRRSEPRTPYCSHTSIR
jgi:hypothetical protein